MAISNVNYIKHAVSSSIYIHYILPRAKFVLKASVLLRYSVNYSHKHYTADKITFNMN